MLKLPKSREHVKRNFLSLKKFVENQFFEVVLSGPILIFYEKFSEIVNLDFEFFICRNPGKNLRKIDFSILVYLDDSKNLESFELYLFFEKNIV